MSARIPHKHFDEGPEVVWERRRTRGAMSQQVLSCYRSLLRARAAVFKGDSRAIVAARDEIRQYFEDVRMGGRCVASNLIIHCTRESLIRARCADSSFI